MTAVRGLMGLALLCMVAAPLRSDLPSWAWSWWFLAALCAVAAGVRRPQAEWWSIRPAAIALLAAGLIDAFMGAWHAEGWDTMRQDGKVLLMLPMVWAIWGARPLMDPSQARASSADVWPDLREALGWALGLQMLVAAAVAWTWPRAWLPATPIPWATGVALSMAILAPWALSRHEASPSSTAWRTGLALAVVAGAVAVVLSRSRAAWVILPWVMLLVVVFARQRLRAGAAMAAVGSLLLALGLWYDSLQPAQVERGVRLLDLLQELAGANQPDASTSVGSRLLLWQAAWESLWAHPWVGVGVEQRIALVQSVVPADQLPGVAPLVHVHHQFLNQAVDHGLPGLMAAALCAAAPWILARRAAPGAMRWQLLGIGVVHTVGLMFNANMTHGTYAMQYALSIGAVLLLHGPAGRRPST